jgi:hypothetical protein
MLPTRRSSLPTSQLPATASLGALMSSSTSRGAQQDSLVSGCGGGAATDRVDVRELHQLLVRQRISNMFRRYVPTKLHRLDIALLRYHGKEEALLRSLVAKFGPEPPFTVEQQRLSDVISESIAARSTHRQHRTGNGDYVDPSSYAGGGGGDADDIEPQLCTASPRPGNNSNSNGDKFQAAVAIVAHHHQLRTRLFETFSAKRTILRMQEEKERDHLHKAMAMDYRHVSSLLNRRQAESILFVQRERSLILEQQVVARRHEEAKIAWFQAQAAAVYQKATGKRDEVAAIERQERRQLQQWYYEERIKQFRHEKRVARLRDAAESEAAQHMRYSNNMDDCTPSGSATPTAHRRRLEDALGESPLDAMLGASSHRGLSFLMGGSGATPPPASQKRSSKWTSPEVCDEILGDLMSQLGTAVASSTGSRLTLPSIATPQPKPSVASKAGGGAPLPLSAVSSPLHMSGRHHWAAEPAVAVAQSSLLTQALPAVRAVGGASTVSGERRRRRRKQKGGGTSSRSRSSRTEGE